jgi:hypothetical protein
MPDILLFNGGDLRALLTNFRQQLTSEVQKADETYLLNTDEEEWAAYLADKYTVEIPTLHPEDQWAEDHGETQVDVSKEHQQRDINPFASTYIVGRAVTVHIPFSGDGSFFQMQASTFNYNPPRATVGQGELKLRFEFPHDRRPAIQSLTQQLINTVEQHLTWQRGDVAGYNSGLLDHARNSIRVRRDRVLRDHEFLGGLGIPVKKREDAPTTYAAQGIARRPAPALPSTKSTGARASAPKALEPTLVNDLYEHICRLTRSMGHAMERTPEGYAKWDEEGLRDGLLVMLNSHYEGKAAGEVFQRAGKTDILVRIEDRNVFIGECKWWSGQSEFTKALNQLFSYTTWRDTKLALVMFVRAKGLTSIVKKGMTTLAEHPQFLSWEDGYEETELRARMSWPGDEERHATVTVFFFHLAEAG